MELFLYNYASTKKQKIFYVFTLSLIFIFFSAFSLASQNLVILELECTETKNGKAQPFKEKIYGLISSNDLSLITHWSGHLNSDTEEVYYHSLEGQINEQGKYAEIRGMMHWAKKKFRDKWLFKRDFVSGFKEALSGSGMKGTIGQGNWQRKCNIRKVDQKALLEIKTNTDINKKNLENKIELLNRKLKLANSRISDLEVLLISKPNINNKNKKIEELVRLSEPNAVCNDNSRAKVSVFRRNKNKWAVFFPGGGSAGSVEEYLKRRKKKYLVSTPINLQKGGSVGKHLLDLDYSLIVLPYCSSDLYQGNHVHKIEGNEIPFRGRIILKSLVNDFKSEFKTASDLVLVGSSAGSVGIGFNIDLFSKFKYTRLILDSFWFDELTNSWYSEIYPKIKPERVNFQFKNLPDHCNGKFSNCWISRNLLDKHKITRAFIIWNDGDIFQSGIKAKNKLRLAIRSDLKYYGAGFSVKALKAKFADNGKGHGMVNKFQAYNQKFSGFSVKSLIENWLKGSGNTIYLE